MAHLQEYWENRYKEETTGWNIGSISRPLREYFEQLDNKSLSILIPGGGFGHETEFLHKSGFTNVHLLDFAQKAVDAFAERVSDFPPSHLHCNDFFQHKGQYDVIIEQTFFCAIEPKLRDKYCQKMLELLKPGGKLVGLLFNEAFTETGPPYGGNINQYRAHFSPHFEIKTMELASNSIERRQGREIFVIMEKQKPSDV